MAIPVIERLIGIEGCPVVTTENLDDFLALDGMVSCSSPVTRGSARRATT